VEGALMDAFAGIVLFVGAFIVLVWAIYSALPSGKKQPRRLRRSRGSFDGNRLAQSIIDVMIVSMFMHSGDHHHDD
jgi:hypothetical protein